METHEPDPEVTSDKIVPDVEGKDLLPPPVLTDVQTEPGAGAVADNEAEAGVEHTGTGWVLKDVVPGQTGENAFLVVRSLGFGDSGVYTDTCVEEVKRRQEAAGLEPNGVVSGESWGLVLRPLKRGQQGWETALLRGVVGLPMAGGWDNELNELLDTELETDEPWNGVLGVAEWRHLIVQSFGAGARSSAKE